MTAQCLCFRASYWVRNISTAVASLVAPTCMVSKHTVEGYYDPEQRFRRFYRWAVSSNLRKVDRFPKQFVDPQLANVE